jgi:CyaY protein
MGPNLCENCHTPILDTAVSDLQFNERIERLIAHIEDVLDETDLDLDYENQGGVFSIEAPNCAPLIVNRHGPTQQLWLATKEGGYHLAWDEARNDWFCTRTDRAFNALWLEATAAQFGTAIEL